MSCDRKDRLLAKPILAVVVGNACVILARLVFPESNDNVCAFGLYGIFLRMHAERFRSARPFPSSLPFPFRSGSAPPLRVVPVRKDGPPASGGTDAARAIRKPDRPRVVDRLARPFAEGPAASCLLPRLGRNVDVGECTHIGA